MEWYKAYQDGILRGSLSRANDTTQLIWLKLLAIENETRLRDGWLHFRQGDPMSHEYLATVCRVSVEELEGALEAYLGDKDMNGNARIEIAPDGDIFIKNWERYQAKPDKLKAKDNAIEKAKDTKRRKESASIALVRAVNRLNQGLQSRRYELTDDGKKILDTKTGEIKDADIS